VGIRSLWPFVSCVLLGVCRISNYSVELFVLSRPPLFFCFLPGFLREYPSLCYNVAESFFPLFRSYCFVSCHPPTRMCPPPLGGKYFFSFSFLFERLYVPTLSWGFICSSVRLGLLTRARPSAVSIFSPLFSPLNKIC